MRRIADLRASLSARGEATARQVRELASRHNLSIVNLVGSAGSGKTTLLESTAKHPSFRRRLGVVEGDLATTLDADRIRALGVPAVQINTKSLCHLEAHMVLEAMRLLPLEGIDLLVVENVGNLVCPADFYLGEDLMVGVLSVTEGNDKVKKYPTLFSKVSAVVLTKVDLLPHLDFDLKRLEEDLKEVNPKASLFPLSAKSGEGMMEWVEFLNALRR